VKKLILISGWLGVGKSTTAKEFRERALVLDTDEIWEQCVFQYDKSKVWDWEYFEQRMTDSDFKSVLRKSLLKLNENMGKVKWTPLFGPRAGSA
jgi:dephospho-CoA kinase